MVLGRFIPALAGNSYHQKNYSRSFDVFRFIPALAGNSEKVMFGHGFGLKSARACGEQ